MIARKTEKRWFFSVLILVGVLNLYTFTFGAKQDGIEDLLKVDSIASAAKENFIEFTNALYVDLSDPDLNREMFDEGLRGYYNLLNRGEVKRKNILTLIDFSKPSSEPRFYIIDLCNRRILHKSLVAHGRNTGGLMARHFSNVRSSHKSSLGFYLTGTTYSGKFDLAMRLNGMEHSNNHANGRGIVMHAAKYATYEFLERNGCVLGRSYGCPSLPFDNFEQVVEWIKEGTVMYMYYPSRSYKRHSTYLNRSDYLEGFVDLPHLVTSSE